MFRSSRAEAHREACIRGRQEHPVDEGGRDGGAVQEGAQARLGGLAVAQAHAHGLALLLQRADLAADAAQVGLELAQHRLHRLQDRVAAADLRTHPAA